MALFKTSTPSADSGFTIMEIIVVIAIFAVLSGFALVVSMGAFHSHNFQSDQNLMRGVLLKARSQAVNNINQKPHGVYFDSATKEFILFQGDDYAHRDTDRDVVFSANENYTLGGATEVVFSQLSGTTTPASVSLDDHINTVYNLCINSEGQINEKAICP